MKVFQRIVDKDNDGEELEDFYDDYPEEDTPDLQAVPEYMDIARIVTARPRRFMDVKSFADKFREGVPVILNLNDASEDESQRIFDFALGVTFGLQGELNKVGERMFLMTPRAVKMEEVSRESSM